MDEDTLEKDGSQDAVLLGLTQDAVYTTMRFSRPFRSCDPHDQDITVNSGERKTMAHKQHILLEGHGHPHTGVPMHLK